MFRKKIIAIIIFGCFLNPINAQINPFTSEPSNGFERNVRSLLDRGKVEMKTTDRVEESTRQEVHVRRRAPRACAPDSAVAVFRPLRTSPVAARAP